MSSSSGPMRMVSIHRHGIYSTDGALIGEAILMDNSAARYSYIYAPLTWASQIEQGRPVELVLGTYFRFGTDDLSSVAAIKVTGQVVLMPTEPR